MYTRKSNSGHVITWIPGDVELAMQAIMENDKISQRAKDLLPNNIGIVSLEIALQIKQRYAELLEVKESETPEE